MMNKFDKILNRRLTDSVKWSRYPADVLPLWVADMDFEAPPLVIQALRDRISHGIFGYPSTQPETPQAVCKWLMARHNWQVSPDDVVLVPNVVQSFMTSARAFCRPGDGVIFQTPAYRPFFDVAAVASLTQQIHQLPRDKSGQYYFDQDGFASSLTPRTRLFLFCNPQNPTGRVFTKTELLEMAEICLSRGILICSDEIHSDLVYSGHKHIPIAALGPEIAHSTVTLISTTKTFNLAGLHASAAVITNPRLRKIFCDHLRGLVGSLNILGETALRTAYQSGAGWLEDLLSYLEKNRDFLVRYVSENLPGVQVAAPEGTYLAWLDCAGTGHENPAQYFLENARVGLNPGTWFGDSYQPFVRLNFGCPRELLQQGLERLSAAL